MKTKSLCKQKFNEFLPKYLIYEQANRRTENQSRLWKPSSSANIAGGWQQRGNFSADFVSYFECLTKWKASSSSSNRRWPGVHQSAEASLVERGRKITTQNKHSHLLCFSVYRYQDDGETAVQDCVELESFTGKFLFELISINNKFVYSQTMRKWSCLCWQKQRKLPVPVEWSTERKCVKIAHPSGQHECVAMITEIHK